MKVTYFSTSDHTFARGQTAQTVSYYGTLFAQPLDNFTCAFNILLSMILHFII